MKSWCWKGFFLLVFSVNSNAVSLSLKGILGNSGSVLDTGFAQATRAIVFQFPGDHMAHPDFRAEWWYFTGNLSTDNLAEDNESEHKFAYQFTLFRFALLPEKQSYKIDAGTKKAASAEKNSSQENPSAWRTKNIYMAHIALTDITNKKFYQQERFSRDGLDLAGAGLVFQEQTDVSLQDNSRGYLKFWLNDWQVKSLENGQLFPLRITVKDKSFSLDLQLETVKPIVLQGEQGLSQKSSRPGNASYYYSYTRLASHGDINIGRETFQVSGNSWFDREWSTSSLGEDQRGWDWFALHLDDGSELMLYQMRKKDGSKDRFSSATLVDSQGKSSNLDSQQFQIKAVEYWLSPDSGIRYPIAWQIKIPGRKINLLVSTEVKQQEWSKKKGFSFNYWEGAVAVRGEKNQQPVSGSGYLEMTGYD